MLEKLICFKSTHGHTQVTETKFDEPGYENLGQWVHMQRSLHTNNDKSLTAERKQRLDDVEFWCGKDDASQQDLYKVGLDQSGMACMTISKSTNISTAICWSIPTRETMEILVVGCMCSTFFVPRVGRVLIELTS